ncbi:hypothetical protein [Leptospira noguchii]|uniref:Uncharacterized protein n=1 Tax=Leptospira noguchii TaxID=28182 RepID=M6VJB8_9LEPT|nr:hypothetical protein [Leptospira noguchii]EMO55126.1 hypothetical protein LEP1GSC172_1622 [Leptospira noguchii]
MKEYHYARERLNSYIKGNAGSLKDDLDLLALERARINLKLMESWIKTNKVLVPDFEQYINLRDSERKLGQAFKKHWHAVYIYRSL